MTASVVLAIYFIFSFFFSFMFMYPFIHILLGKDEQLNRLGINGLG